MEGNTTSRNKIALYSSSSETPWETEDGRKQPGQVVQIFVDQVK